MSVILYDAQELADVATLAVLGAPPEARALPHFAPGVIVCLAKFSEANLAAFRRTYVEGRDVVRFEDASARPCTAAEILDAVRTVPDATAVFLNLGYNAVSNGGTDFLDDTTRRALAAVEAWAASAQTELTPLPPGRKSKKDPRHYGEKYDAAKSVDEIPALVRADLKAAVARGELPRGKYSVRKRRCTHSWAIDVRVSDVAGLRLNNPERLLLDRDRPHEYVPPFHCPYSTPEAKAVLDKCSAILGAYNHDGSDSQSDYYDVRYYGDAGWDHDWERARREVEMAELPPRQAKAVQS